MLNFTQGNLLESKAEALVNTVNTVGVMGKGIALMFKERFPLNYQLYAEACKAGKVQVGRMFSTRTGELGGPTWVVNFPTKKHWKGWSQLEWIEEGLMDLRAFLAENGVKSIALPPLGAGNGGLDWLSVKAVIIRLLGDVDGVNIDVYEPINQYQNVAKRTGVEKLTPARAMVAELVRRYWFLGMECSLLEIQKLAWFLERSIERLGAPNDLNLKFKAHRYGPYANRLSHLLNSLDGSYLKSDKRIADAGPDDVILFNDDRKDLISAYLQTEAKQLTPALEATAALIEGFESPYGMELLASIDWLLWEENVEPTVAAVKEGLENWPATDAPGAGKRKAQIFDERSVAIALEHLKGSVLYQQTST